MSVTRFCGKGKPKEEYDKASLLLGWLLLEGGGRGCPKSDIRN